MFETCTTIYNSNSHLNKHHVILNDIITLSSVGQCMCGQAMDEVIRV